MCPNSDESSGVSCTRAFGIEWKLHLLALHDRRARPPVRDHQKKGYLRTSSSFAPAHLRSIGIVTEEAKEERVRASSMKAQQRWEEKQKYGKKFS